uniref:Uncharacterized protein n=1 Tax=Pipistrellus kuhlii TaxID=59472 RepID=A0A7J7W352_PIPKU|nr:hypothetical protein mPipKuh1_008157 [Pipistrellus kuhlii]
MNLSIPRPRSDNDGRGESFISLRDDVRNTVVDVSDPCSPTSGRDGSVPAGGRQQEARGGQPRCLTVGAGAGRQLPRPPPDGSPCCSPPLPFDYLRVIPRELGTNLSRASAHIMMASPWASMARSKWAFLFIFSLLLFKSWPSPEGVD